MIFPQDEQIFAPWHLVLFKPVYNLIRRYRPEWCKIPAHIKPDIYASAMLQEGNWAFNLIFPPFFRKIRFEIADENEILRAGREGTIVYVARGIGQLEYNYFAHLFRETGLPLSCFANGISFRRWMPWQQYKSTLITQMETLKKNGGIDNPVTSGWLAKTVEEGKSVLLSLTPSELEDESILLSYSQRLLLSLITAQKKNSRPIFIVPLEFVWDKRPSRAEKSVIDILFGEKESPGRIRKAVLFWRNYGRRAVVKIGEPIGLSKFLGGENELKEDAQARRLAKELQTVIKMERRTITGPLIRPRGWFAERVLVDESFQQKVCEVAAKLGKPADDLMELAKRYVKEIAADINYTYIELGHRLLNWVFKSLFSGLIFNQEGLAQAKRLYSKAPVVFVPNHKSHVDYLILSYILYNNNMTIPHVAAGLNLSFWPLGPLFRHCGAYFIRRSFQNNELYRLTVETYLKILLEEGYSQEFFIEGGRSRTGKLLPPRHGLLSLLTKAVTSGDIKELHFVPVSFTYDRVIEQKSYEKELEGGAKEKEKPSHLLRLIKYLKRRKGRYGKIYVNFGHPISYREGDVEDLAQNICREINRNLVVTPQSVVAAALLTNPERGLTLETVYERSKVFLDWLKYRGAPLSQSLLEDEKKALKGALDTLTANHYVTLHEETSEPLYAVEEDRRLKLEYFKNSSVHFFASIGVIATLLKRGAVFDADKLKADFEACRRLLKYEFRFSTSRPVNEHIKKITDFLITKDKSAFIQFSNMIANYFESIKIALAPIKWQKIERMDEKELIKEMTANGKNMLLLGQIKHTEAISKANFTNALRLMCDQKILRDHRDELGTRGRKIYSSLSNTEAIANLQVQLERLT